MRRNEIGNRTCGEADNNTICYTLNGSRVSSYNRRRAGKPLSQNGVDWGADIIFGGHPVTQPSETLKDGQKKLIKSTLIEISYPNPAVETMEGVENAPADRAGSSHGSDS